ncbi:MULTISPECIES: hypothetical protein [unclassified Arenibacter]|jgi:hypothetical protein|uniref:hypothetical protein n=1 Tax=unclassified Arenibacter TaxID=2615047 RepID=UPI000E35305E|nr:MULTISPECIES: hypothetical protein [unclassified Arenibacter]MCM4162373.1 hypothetical protein [Arenibacter sp. A80]RFT57968.1 hypothetical protein D0S24_02070 [Arenibacter sp. P308M17]
MIYVTVSYRIKPEFVPENKANIDKFLKDFKSLDTSEFEYRVFLKEDGKTFVHTSSYVDVSVQNKILNVPSFLEFQRRRDESGLNDSHLVEILECVGGTSQPLQNG